MRARIEFVTPLVLLLLTVQTVLTCAAPAQSPELALKEAQTVYFGNLARRKNGVPPLRWNKQLTDAARWFAWDSVENRANGFCGHQDTQGNWPDDRAGAFGYKGGAGAENAYCGYMEPQDAIDGWMNSAGHRANLLDPNSREIGMGYYLRPGDRRGYEVQDFGADAVYPPVIIENEAITTTTPSVQLYIYDRQVGSGGFAGMGAAADMMLSNDACFAGAAWEPYNANKVWNLTAGEGWRTVYAKTRDTQGRTTTAGDKIFLGANVPLNQIGDAQMSTTQSQVTLYNLDGGAFNQAQFSLEWMADDTFDTFNLWWGNGGRVNDTAAWGGTAFRLQPGNGESFAWVWTTDFVKDVPLVAYFRLKVNNNSAAGEVARISVQGGGVEYGLRSLKGIDFAAANQYQEFAVPFVFNTNPDDPYLMFNFWRSGAADVYVDAVTIFTAPRTFTASTPWDVPGGNYRGQGVWVRYTNGGNSFSAYSEANTHTPTLDASRNAIPFLGQRTGPPPNAQILHVSKTCGDFDWHAASDAAWLTTQKQGDTVTVQADPNGLANGVYRGNVILAATNLPGVAPVQIAVTFNVVEQLHTDYMPFLFR